MEMQCLCLSHQYSTLCRVPMSLSFTHFISSHHYFVILQGHKKRCWDFHQLKSRPFAGKRLQLIRLRYWLHRGGLGPNQQHLWDTPAYIGLLDTIGRYKILKMYQLLHVRLQLSLYFDLYWHENIQVEMKEDGYSVVMEMRTFYLQISHNPSHITDDQSGWPLLAGFQVECWGITGPVVAWGCAVTRQSLCAWSMEMSSVEMGFGLILGKLGKVAAELLPDGLSPHLLVII